MADEENYESSETQDKEESSTRHSRLQWKCLDFGWIIYTWPGRFKLAEFLTSLLGFICIASVNAFDEEPRYEFFVFVGIFSWIMVCIHIILGIPHLIEKLPGVVTQPLVFLACCGLAVLAWLIASSIIMAKDKNDTTVQAGAVFGYITMFLFFFEALYYIIVWRRGRSASRERENKEMDNPAEADDYVQPEDPAY
ncbi:uncharacterized protein LOC114520036 [Dendronephthya gigantea]|uniref:uncharacterized protein LOC114520036 n=1 Tax=Dendronephthya gigantea TaxID=151771 RepID=UPI00106D5A39|nr:uncharacterized protein LOC114520036 [Dendronephthya gigantea]